MDKLELELNAVEMMVHSINQVAEKQVLVIEKIVDPYTHFELWIAGFVKQFEYIEDVRNFLTGWVMATIYNANEENKEKAENDKNN